MTLLLGWRDPFCLLSDDVATDPQTGLATSVGPKIAKISEKMACGTAGFDVLGREFRERAVDLPVTNWPIFEEKMRELLNELNGRFPTLPESMRLSCVAAGTIEGTRGIAEWQPNARAMPVGLAFLNEFATGGTGGRVAHVTLNVARLWRPEAKGADLLKLMVEAAVRTDAYTKPPIWRIDLEGGASEPQIWGGYEQGR
jgi:hypothetical protein